MAFLGAKGGVGTTSGLLNVTEALSAQHSAIAFETAAQGGFAFQMDALRSVDGGRSAPLKLDREWLSRSVEPTSNGAGVLFSPLLPWRGTEAANGIAKQILRLSKTVADFVMIDAGCHLDGLTAALVSECQAVTIVLDCEPASTAAAREMLRLLQPLSRSGCEVSILAVNRSGVAKPPTAEQTSGILWTASTGRCSILRRSGRMDAGSAGPVRGNRSGGYVDVELPRDRLAADRGRGGAQGEAAGSGVRQ